MELYLIRHGQSTNNLIDGSGKPEHETARVVDPPLTDIGQQQAQYLAEYLATAQWKALIYDPVARRAWMDEREGFGFTQLYCSAMYRALQTAQPIGKALGVRPEVWLDVHEHGGMYLDHGEVRGRIGYPGKTRVEILSEFPDYVLPETITDKGWWTSGYEDLPTAFGRAVRVATALRERADTESGRNERIAIISHGTFMNALIKALLDSLPSRNQYYLHYNTGMTYFALYKGGLIDLRHHNRIDHLPLELVTH